MTDTININNSETEVNEEKAKKCVGRILERIDAANSDHYIFLVQLYNALDKNKK